MSQATRPACPPRSGRAQPATAPAPIVAGYAAVVYLLFLAVFGYAAGFFAGAGVPKGIDQGPRAAGPVAAGIDLLLLSLFAVQHTVMARPWFKRRWARIVPAPAERATYVLAASLALALLFWLWRPIGGTVWNLSEPGAAWQGQGVGSALVRALVTRAQARGVTSIAMEVLPANHRVLAMIDRGWPAAETDRFRESAAIHVRLPPADQLPTPSVDSPAYYRTGAAPKERRSPPRTRWSPPVTHRTADTSPRGIYTHGRPSGTWPTTLRAGGPPAAPGRGCVS